MFEDGNPYFPLPESAIAALTGGLGVSAHACCRSARSKAPVRRGQGQSGPGGAGTLTWALRACTKAELPLTHVDTPQNPFESQR